MQDRHGVRHIVQTEHHTTKEEKDEAEKEETLAKLKMKRENARSRGLFSCCMISISFFLSYLVEPVGVASMEVLSSTFRTIVALPLVMVMIFLSVFNLQPYLFLSDIILSITYALASAVSSRSRLLSVFWIGLLKF